MTVDRLDILLPLLGLAAAVATLAGGALALRLSGRIHLILGFSAGAVIGVALLDLLPEALGLSSGRFVAVTAFVALGFMAYLAADRVLGMAGQGGRRGHLGAGSLTLHSAMDGLAIGLSFQVSAATAVVVTLAVLAHDLSDGINTVNVSLTGGAGRSWARRWLLADAIAPLVGIGLSRLVSVPRADLALFLAAFAGFFLCIGATELIPASHERHPRAWTTIATLAGCAIIWLVVRLANFGASP
ncbi:MAG TPA: ZIP family metal transporter [Caulobacteraceae bacterium]